MKTVKFLINGNLFGFVTDSNDEWQHILCRQIVQMCEFVSIGNDIIKCRHPNKYTVHVDINEKYNQGNFTQLPVKVLTPSRFDSLIYENLNGFPERNNYLMCYEDIYNIFDLLVKKDILV